MNIPAGRKPFRAVKISLLLLVLLAAVLLPVKHAGAFTYQYKTFPEGTLGIARPDIGVKLTLGELAELTSYTMYLNGKEVKADNAPGTLSFVYHPASDLAAGAYKVKLVLRFQGYQDGSLEWGFTILAGASSGFSAPNSEQSEGLQAINDYRILNNLPVVTFHDALNEAAKRHANYLAMNQVHKTTASLHDEDPSRPGYIGKSLKQRSEYIGYSGGMGEDAAYTSSSLVEAIDDLFKAPYHRIPFLNPNVAEIGVYRDGDYHVIEFGYAEAKAVQLVVSPAEGDAFVPISFDGNESPDPLQIHGGEEYPVGYPIMASISGPDVLKASLTDAQLMDEKGNLVKLLKNHQGNDSHLDTDVILIPEEPLQPDSTYQAYVKLTAVKKDGNIQKFEKNWRFKTEPSVGVGVKKLHADSSDYVRQLIQSGLGRKHTVTFGLDDSTYYLDQIGFPMRVRPYILDGTSYLYIRDLASALGAAVEWEDSKKAAIYTKKNATIKFFTGRSFYELDGKEYPTSFPARLINETTMIPVRLLSETLGAKVDYVDRTRTVVITY